MVGEGKLAVGGDLGRNQDERPDRELKSMPEPRGSALKARTFGSPGAEGDARPRTIEFRTARGKVGERAGP